MSEIKERAFEILRENPHIHYSDLADKAGYASESSGWQAKHDFKKKNPELYEEGSQPTQSNQEPQNADTDEPTDTQRIPHESQRDADTGATETPTADTDGGTDSIEVETNPGNKLKPANAPTAIDPPEGMPDDTRPADFEFFPSEPSEPDNSDNPNNPNNPNNSDDFGNSDNPDNRDNADNQNNPSNRDNRDDFGNSDNSDNADYGFDSFFESDEPEPDTHQTRQIVEDAPNDRERQRREDVLSTFEQSTTASDPEQPGQSPGLVVDEDLLAELIGMPFAQIGGASEWDGWELTKDEKKTNAKLLAAYCEENDIDLGTGTMLAVSLSSTVGGRVVRYNKWKKSDSNPKAIESEEASEPEQPATPTAEADGGSGGTSNGDFDSYNPETW